jgi:hypothetical protein
MKNDNAQMNIDGKVKNESLCEESDAKINKHGGEVSVESQIGVGTTFHI